MHVALVYQYYHNLDCPGSGRHYTFAREWSRGHRVTIVTTDTMRATRLSDDSEWTPDGVELVEFHVPYSNRMGPLRRLWPYAVFARRVAAWRPAEPIDIVVGSSTPLTAAWAARRLARRLGVPWVMEVRDLWPDFPIQMGAVPFLPVRRRLKRLESDLYRTADHVVTLSPDMRAHVLRTAGVQDDRVSVVVQGTNPELLDSAVSDHAAGMESAARGATGAKLAGRPPEVAPSSNRAAGASGPEAGATARAAPAEPAGTDPGSPNNDFPSDVPGYPDETSPGRFSVLYAGMLGRANAIPELLETAARLRARADIQFRFAGYGRHAQLVADTTARSPNVIFARTVAHPDVFRLFRSASVSVVAFLDLPVLGANAPAKLFDSLAAGTPVIVTTTGWMKELVETERTGWYSPASPGALSELIERLADNPDEVAEAGRRGAAYAAKHFDRRYLAARMLETLEQTVDHYRVGKTGPKRGS